VPSLESVQAALSQLAEWGNLIAQPDTARVSTLEDFYRARFVYRLSAEGEAVEAGMAAFEQALARRAELQSVALEDIEARVEALYRLSTEAPLDVTKVHQALRDLLVVFTSLSENAQAFMAGIARSLELQHAEAQALMSYKQRLIDYLERFVGDLVVRSSAIAGVLGHLKSSTDALLSAAARREARDAAPDDADSATVFEQKLVAWRERWTGLELWVVASPLRPSQAELLRGRARSAIPQLLAAISSLNDRRSGKSDRSADFQILARWFAECESDYDAHRLYRAAFALSPARHLALLCPEADVPASTPWSKAPAVAIHPKLRERGSLAPRGPSPRVRDRTRERHLLAAALAAEQAQIDAARAKLACGRPVPLSDLGPLDKHEFRLLLTLIGEALAAQKTPEDAVERHSGDGTLRIRLVPLDARRTAHIQTDLGTFSGRDHELTVWHSGEPHP
jgi:uncharacterized protein (TIGR02677 family)